MKEPNIDEGFLQEIMSKSKLQVPTSDFKDKVMRQVEMRRLQKDSASRDIKLSWIFFVTGSFFGIIISLILPFSGYSFAGIGVSKLTLPFQILFVLIFMTHLNNLLDFYKETRGTKRFHGQ